MVPSAFERRASVSWSRSESLDEQVRIFCERPLEGRYPYLWLDAKVECVRESC